MHSSSPHFRNASDALATSEKFQRPLKAVVKTMAYVHQRLRSVSVAGLPCVRIAQKPEKGRWFAMIAWKARNRSSMTAAKVSAFS